MTCTRCGAINPPGAKFCNNCGSTLVASGPGPGAPPVSPGQTVSPVRAAEPITLEQAKLAVILGIISWVLCGFLTGIPAVLVGRKAIRQIRQSRGRFKGEEIALAGVIMGYASCALWLVFLVGGYFVFNRATKEIGESETGAIDAIRQINAAEASYAEIYSSSSGRVYAGSLATLGPGPSGTCVGSGTREYACLMNGPLVARDCREPNWCTLKGYKFQLQTHYSYSSRDADYAITAVPVGNGEGGTKSFCSTSDGVVRSEVRWGTLRAGYNIEECHRLIPVDKSS